MQTELTTQRSFKDKFFARESWMGPVSGFVCSVAVLMVGRILHFEYRRELSSAVFFLVMVLVSTHYDGKLKKRPVANVGWAVAAALVGAAITHWFSSDPGTP